MHLGMEDGGAGSAYERGQYLFIVLAEKDLEKTNRTNTTVAGRPICAANRKRGGETTSFVGRM